MKITSQDIKLGLRAKFPAPGWQLFYEVGDSTGAQQRRWADAVAMGIWPSNGHLIHGMEIKVSRGDFLSEMKNPTKSQAIFRFCHRWSLVTPVGLVKADELPETWGLMTFDGKSTRVVKQPPALTPEPLTPGFVAALVRRAGERDDALLSAAVANERHRLETAFDARLSESIRRDRESRVNRSEGLVEKLAAYEAIFGRMPTYAIEQMAPAVKLVEALGVTRTYGGVNAVLKGVEDLSTKVRPLLEEMRQPDAILGDLM